MLDRFLKIQLRLRYLLENKLRVTKEHKRSNIPSSTETANEIIENYI